MNLTSAGGYGVRAASCLRRIFARRACGGRGPGGARRFMIRWPVRLETPSQSAIAARRRWCVADKGGTKFAVGAAVPDLAQRLLGGVAECVAVVTARRERRDTARQRAAMRGEIHQRPGPPARRPRRLVIAALEAQPGLGRTRGIKRHAQLVAKRLGGGDGGVFIGAGLVEQRRSVAREAALEPVEHEALQINLAYPETGGEPNKIGQLRDRLFKAGQPQRHAWGGGADFLLQRDEFPDIAQDAVEKIPAANLQKTIGIGGVERDAQFVEPAVDQLSA